MLDTLPTELIWLICDYLTPNDIKSWSLTCKLFYDYLHPYSLKFKPILDTAISQFKRWIPDISFNDWYHTYHNSTGFLETPVRSEIEKLYHVDTSVFDKLFTKHTYYNTYSLVIIINVNGRVERKILIDVFIDPWGIANYHIRFGFYQINSLKFSDALIYLKQALGTFEQYHLCVAFITKGEIEIESYHYHPTKRVCSNVFISDFLLPYIIKRE
ncbi:Uncharacterised protein [uncultured archaeon]|nr:Uncharacterised protein [uncultured archaeon]